MSNDVKVVISLSKASPRAGFGFPLIFAGKQPQAVPYTVVGSLAEVVTAGFAAETEVYQAAQLLFMQNEAPSKIAVCAATSDTVTALPSVLGEDWRQLIVVSGDDDSDATAISDYIESCGKKASYFCSVDSSAFLSEFKGNKRTTVVVYAGTDVATPEAAIVGATAGREVGSFTYKNIILKGVTAQAFTDAEVDTLHEAGGITYLLKAGSIVTSEGTCASGEYIDIVDSEDYIIEQIEYQSQRLLNRVPKLFYDNRGISSLEGVVLSVLLDAARNGMIAQNEDGSYAYSVNFLSRAECAEADISARDYKGGSFSFELAGAIHNAVISGEIIA